jgi:hypothetical protein
LVAAVVVHIVVVKQHLAVRAVVDVTMLVAQQEHRVKEMMVVMAVTQTAQAAAAQELKVQHLVAVVLVE